jgi:hypothetical protein
MKQPPSEVRYRVVPHAEVGAFLPAILDIEYQVYEPARRTPPAELRAAMEAAIKSRKPTLINAVIDETAGTESGRITSLNPTAGKKM